MSQCPYRASTCTHRGQTHTPLQAVSSSSARHTRSDRVLPWAGQRQLPYGENGWRSQDATAGCRGAAGGPQHVERSWRGSNGISRRHAHTVVTTTTSSAPFHRHCCQYGLCILLFRLCGELVGEEKACRRALHSNTLQVTLVER